MNDRSDLLAAINKLAHKLTSQNQCLQADTDVYERILMVCVAVTGLYQQHINGGV